MKNENSYLVIKETVLPEVFQKVLLATELLENGEAASASEAVKKAGISRSVYYKYKDAVFPYIKKEADSILTVQLMLVDKPGVLMNVLSYFYKAEANILTVNQNIPVKGKAFVSISAKIEKLKEDSASFLKGMANVPGVIKIDSISD